MFEKIALLDIPNPPDSRFLEFCQCLKNTKLSTLKEFFAPFCEQKKFEDTFACVKRAIVNFQTDNSSQSSQSTALCLIKSEENETQSITKPYTEETVFNTILFACYVKHIAPIMQNLSETIIKDEFWDYRIRNFLFVLKRRPSFSFQSEWVISDLEDWRENLIPGSNVTLHSSYIYESNLIGKEFEGVVVSKLTDYNLDIKIVDLKLENGLFVCGVSICDVRLSESL